MSETRSFYVPEGLAGLRLDAGLARLMGVSRSTVAGWVADQLVEIDGVVASKSSVLKADAHIYVTMPATAADPGVIVPQEVPGLSILHEDDDIIVIDKPVGVAVHSSPGWEGPTVLAGLAAAGRRITTSGAPERQGVVQRLDVGTSGVMMLAKSEYAYSVLKQAFRDRTVHKKYHAIVQGLPDPLTGTIEAPIGRHPTQEYKMAVLRGGKHSVTHYELLEAFIGASLIEVELETGRTHQIRVHFSALKHPCVGDPMYGCDPKLAARLKLERQWLHAVELAFEHPGTGEQVVFTSEYPADLQHALEVLRHP